MLKIFIAMFVPVRLAQVPTFKGTWKLSMKMSNNFSVIFAKEQFALEIHLEDPWELSIAKFAFPLSTKHLDQEINYHIAVEAE